MSTEQKSYGQLAYEQLTVYPDSKPWKEAHLHAKHYWENAAMAVIAAYRERETVEGWRLLKPGEIKAQGDRVYYCADWEEIDPKSIGLKQAHDGSYPTCRRDRFLRDSHQQDERANRVALRPGIADDSGMGSPAGEPICPICPICQTPLIPAPDRDGVWCDKCKEYPQLKGGVPMTETIMPPLTQPAEGPNPGAGDSFRAGIEKAIEIVEEWMADRSPLTGTPLSLFHRIKRERDAHIGRPAPEIEETNLMLGQIEQERDRLKEELTEAESHSKKCERGSWESGKQTQSLSAELEQCRKHRDSALKDVDECRAQLADAHAQERLDCTKITELVKEREQCRAQLVEVQKELGWSRQNMDEWCLGSAEHVPLHECISFALNHFRGEKMRLEKELAALAARKEGRP